MEINILNKGDEIIATIDGEVDTTTASDLRKALQPYLTEATTTLILECEKLTYISSSGLRVILLAQKHMTALGGQFILRHLIPEVRSVIDMTGLSRIIAIQ